MAYLIANQQESVFQTRIHHFSPRPTGPRLVESPSSRMAILSAPWSESKTLITNMGSLRVAAYVLTGADSRDGVVTRCYVGETTDLPQRFKKHIADPGKAFVNEAYVIGSLDRDFDKLDVQMLQFRLNEQIESVDRAYIVRGVRPSFPSVNAARAKRSEDDFRDVRRFLPSIGCCILEPRTTEVRLTDNVDDIKQLVHQSSESMMSMEHTAQREYASEFLHSRHALDSQSEANPRRGLPRPAIFSLNHAGFVAFGYQDEGEFVVLPGSQMRRDQMRSFGDDSANKQRRKDIIDAQVTSRVKGFDDRWQLSRERRFPSRGIAAKVLMGVNLNNQAWIAVNANPPPEIPFAVE